MRESSSLKLALENQKLVKGMTVIEEVNNETLIKRLQGGRYGHKGAIMGGEVKTILDKFLLKSDL